MGPVVDGALGADHYLGYVTHLACQAFVGAGLASGGVPVAELVGQAWRRTSAIGVAGIEVTIGTIHT